MWKKTLVAIALLFCAHSPASALSGSSCRINEDLLFRALSIAYETEEVSRTEKTIELMNSVDSLSPSEMRKLDDRTIQGITLLLKDKNHWVKVYAAMALGIVGPKAIGSVPALEAARSSLVEPVAPGQLILSPVDGKLEFDRAIKAIRGVIPPQIS